MLRFEAIFISTLLTCLGYGLSFPTYAALLNETGVSGFWVGFHVALPALGWILGSFLVPVLQLKRRLTIKAIALSFLGLALLGLAIGPVVSGYSDLTLSRFVFGGAVGVHLRCVEYIVTANSGETVRGRNLAAYSASFMTGIFAGAAVAPEFGGWRLGAFVLVGVFMACGAVVLALSLVKEISIKKTKLDWSVAAVVSILPLAFVIAMSFGLYESIPADLIQIYALRSGLGESVAAYTLSAAALGNLLLLFPLLMLSDRVGRLPVLALCAAISTLIPLFVDGLKEDTVVLLAVVAVWAGAAGATYALALAMLGDSFNGERLVLANATFGVLYAAASIVGPLMHGLAFEYIGNVGIMYSSSAIFAVLLAVIGYGALIRRNGKQHV